MKVCGEYTICHHNRTAFHLPPPRTESLLCGLYTCLKSSQLVSRSSPKRETSRYLFEFVKITRPRGVLDWPTISEVNTLRCCDDTGQQFSWSLETKPGFQWGAPFFCRGCRSHAQSSSFHMFPHSGSCWLGRSGQILQIANAEETKLTEEDLHTGLDATEILVPRGSSAKVRPKETLTCRSCGKPTNQSGMQPVAHNVHLGCTGCSGSTLPSTRNWFACEVLTFVHAQLSVTVQVQHSHIFRARWLWPRSQIAGKQHVPEKWTTTSSDALTKVGTLTLVYASYVWKHHQLHGLYMGLKSLYSVGCTPIFGHTISPCCPGWCHDEHSWSPQKSSEWPSTAGHTSYNTFPLLPAAAADRGEEGLGSLGLCYQAAFQALSEQVPD